MKKIIHNFQSSHPIKQFVILLWIIFFIIGFFSLFFFSNEEIKKFLLGIIGSGISVKTIIIFLGLFLLRVVLFFPMSLLLILAPIIFGNILIGIALSGIGQIIGASFGFYLARYYGKEFLKTKNSKMMNIVNDKLKNYGKLSIVLLRIIPIFPYDIINFSSGLSQMKFSVFLIATGISVWPDCLLYGLLGGSFNDPKSIIFAISFGIIIFVFLFYLKNHPDFKDFFVMKLKEKITKMSKKKKKLKNSFRNKIKKIRQQKYFRKKKRRF